MNLTFSDIWLTAPFPAIQIDRQYGDWNLAIHTGNHCRFNTTPSNLPHYHEQGHELCYVLGGAGQYDHGDARFTLRQGDLFLCDPTVMHEISSYATRDLWLVFIVIFPQLQSTRTRNPKTYTERLVHEFNQGHHTHQANQTQLLSALLPLLATGNTQHDFYARENALEQFTLTAMAALCNVEVPFAPPHTMTPHDAPAESPLLQQAIRFVDQHMESPLLIDEVASEIGCTARHLLRLCQRHRQQSFIQLIQQRRMSHAARLLLMNLPVSEVARRLGIQHLSQFSRQFKRVVGESPKSFQAKYHAAVNAERASWI